MKTWKKFFLYIFFIYGLLLWFVYFLTYYASINYKNNDYHTALTYYKISLFFENSLFIGDYKFLHSRIGAIYNSLEEYQESLKYVKKVEKELEENFEENFEEIVVVYTNIAILYKNIGKYNNALIYHKKSLTILEKKFGQDFNNLDKIYSTLGSFYFEIGEYNKAVNYYKKALTILEKKFGNEDSRIAAIYDDLGNAYAFLNNHNKALIYYKKALKIEKSFTPHNKLTLAYLFNHIAYTLTSMNRSKDALTYYKKSLKVLEKKFGKYHSDVALNYMAIGNIYLEKERKKSLDYYQQSLNILQKLSKEDNSLIATNYFALGSYYSLNNEHIKALIYYEKSLKIFQKIFQKKHPNMIRVHLHIGGTYIILKNYKEAYIHIEKSLELFFKYKEKYFTVLNRKEKKNYLNLGKDPMSTFFIINFLYLSELVKNNNYIKVQKTLQVLLNNWIRYKGNLFEYQNILHMFSQNPKISKQIKKEIEELKILTSQLENFDIDKQKNIQKLINKIEINLSSKNKYFKEILKLQSITYEEILLQLNKKELYIDFAYINKNYYYLTLDKTNGIRFIPIGSSNINKNIENFRKNNKKMVEIIKDEKLLEQQKEVLIKKLKEESQKILSNLYNTLINNYLSIQLKDKNSLIISPDGLLNFLPFEALYHNGRYLIEDYKISYISSGREFVRQTKREKANFSREMICFGNPDFNASLPNSETKQIGGNDVVEETWEQFQTFKPIGNKEILTINKFYKNALIYQKENATVENLMGIGSSKILHFSTHGKFLNNESIENPMLKAGLAFSGANKNIAEIATALKLSALDLKDTELVVLSACESGVGEVQNAEGVMGLPKAFLQAGARSVIMSLWSVSNQKTAELIESFYTNVKNNNQDYETALRNAKLKMIEKHPYYWSAFIMHGI